MILLRKDKTYKLDKLPSLKSNQFLWNGLIGYTGSKITRRVKGSLGIYIHVGFVYGFDETDTLLVIENNVNGVECISFRDFIGDAPYKITFNTDSATITGIMVRAVERSKLIYDARSNNCDHFVNYCLTGKVKSTQVENTERVANILFSIGEVYMVSGGVDPGLIENYSKLRQTLRIERPKEIQELLDKHAQKFNSIKQEPAQPANKSGTRKPRRTKSNSNKNSVHQP